MNTSRGRFVIAIFLIMTLSLVEGCSRTRVMLEGQDTVSLPQRKIQITATLRQRNIFLKDIETQPIEFRLVSGPETVKLHSLKKGMTDDEGVARAELFLPATGLFEVETTFHGSKRFFPDKDNITILVLDPQKPVLVLDVDNTLTNKNWLHVNPFPIPYDRDTVRVVNGLSRRYAIVYLSARPQPLHTLTEKWLKKYGFPNGPIILWYPSKLTWLKPSHFKEDQLLALRRSGVNLVAGIGNTESDIKVYRKAGMDPIMLGKQSKDTVCALNWAQIETILADFDAKEPRP
ncbi:MAG: hypothetical protein WC975_03870 [Phycisphaerae bacterium]